MDYALPIVYQLSILFKSFYFKQINKKFIHLSFLIFILINNIIFITLKTFFLFKKLLKNINLNECSILKINKNNILNILKLIINTLNINIQY